MPVHHRALGALACLAALAVLLCGCSRGMMPAVQPLRTTILIMDFDVPEAYSDPDAVAQPGGWWLGAYMLYRNPNAGRQFADVLTLRMRAETGDWASLFDRLYLRQYFARKRALLREEYSSLSEAEIDRLMDSTPPEAFARDLGADKVLAGRIQSHQKVNSATRFYASTAVLEARLIDVDTGQELWRYADKETDLLDSEIAVYEEIAARMVEDMKTQYFFREESN